MCVRYYSQRTGLADLVVGLIEGLAEKYQEHITLWSVPRIEGSDHDQFEVTFLPA